MKKILLFLILCFTFLSPGFCSDYFYLGKEAFYKKDYNNANLYFVKALYQDPNDAQCRYYYAQTLVYLKNFKQAEIEFGYVVQLAPGTILERYSLQSLKNLKTNKTQQNSQNFNNKTYKPENYLKNALNSSGQLVTWNAEKMPLKIYIDNQYNAPTDFINAVKKALLAWENASDGFIKFLHLDEKEYADVIISFTGMAQQTGNQTLGYTKQTISDDTINSANIVLYTLGPKYQKLTATDIYNVTLHEIGHMLGISGHSDASDDVMYAMYNTQSKQGEFQLSARDKNTIITLYQIDKNPYSTNYNSINRLLGDKTKRINEKLQQELDYIETVPQNAIGYVNVGNSYLAMEKEYEAINYYKKALKISPDNFEANIALANIYTKRNDLTNAAIYYKKIIQLAPKESSAYINLSNLYLKNGKKSDAQRTMGMLLYRNHKAKDDEAVKTILNNINNMK